MIARIMIVDDDPLVRSGLRLLLGGDPGLEIVADAANGQEALDNHGQAPVDLVLMDLRMPVLDGFLLKDTPPDEIVAAIHNVLAGRPALSPSVTAALIKQVVDGGGARSATAASRIATLTAREKDVALELARGATNAEIAERLYMSLATVKAHISHIFTKLDASNRVQVAILMHDAGEV